MSKKERLKNYIMESFPDDYKPEEAMKLIDNMTVNDILEAMDEAQKILETLKNTPLGKELV